MMSPFQGEVGYVMGGGGLVLIDDGWGWGPSGGGGGGLMNGWMVG